MRQKELRIALVCYGGVSLAVYMHGVTKELWKLARASRAHIAGQKPPEGTETVYAKALRALEREHGLRLRVLPDIIAGAALAVSTEFSWPRRFIPGRAWNR